MGLLESIAELLKSVWDADRRVRSESALGESEFSCVGGRRLAMILIAVFVLAAGFAVWMWIR